MKTSILGFKQEIRQLSPTTSPADADVFVLQNVTDNLLYKIEFSDLENAIQVLELVDLNLISFENQTVYFEGNSIFN